MTERPGNLARWRLALLAGLLAMALLLTGVLAWQAVAAGRHQREAAERSLVDYADFAAHALSTVAYREYGIRVLSTFAGLPPLGTPALFTRPGANLGCGPRGAYFEYDPRKQELRSGEGALPAAGAARLRDTLSGVQRLFNEAQWRFRFIRLDMADAGSGVFITSAASPEGFVVRGLTTCLWQDTVFTGLLGRARALPPSLTRGMPAESLYTVAIHDSAGTVYYRSMTSYGGPLRGRAALGPEFGDLAIGVALNPAIAPGLLIGGTPPSRAPAAILLFGLSAALLAAAATQLRREYRLIAARSDFVSNVSHELRTPLSQILIFTELLKLDRLRTAEERGRALDIIDKETRRLIRLVENILQFSRRSGGAPLATEPVPLGPFTRETADAFRPLADGRRATLALDVPTDLTVQAERNALRQILVNLLDNAVKYGPEGQTVRINAQRDNGTVELAVEDQGPGVPVPDRDRIWVGYERLDRDGGLVSGSGIGLAVVRSLVERMGGAAAVGDSGTGGARFTIRLPAGGSG